MNWIGTGEQSMLIEVDNKLADHLALLSDDLANYEDLLTSYIKASSSRIQAYVNYPIIEESIEFTFMAYYDRLGRVVLDMPKSVDTITKLECWDGTAWVVETLDDLCFENRQTHKVFHHADLNASHLYRIEATCVQTDKDIFKTACLRDVCFMFENRGDGGGMALLGLAKQPDLFLLLDSERV